MIKKLLYILIGSYVFCLEASAQYKNLVFEGAGIRGLAYAGAIAELERRDMLVQIEKVAGTSAGATTALMLALGYTSAEIMELISETHFKEFNDGQYFFIGGLFRTKNQFGWYRSERINKWLENVILFKTADANITFQQMRKMGYKDLYITATSLNRQKMIVLSKDSYPDMKVKDAVRISMSIPLYFQPAFMDSMGRVYEDFDEDKNLDIVIDGGLVGNFPIFIFDSLDNGERVPNPETLGLRIDSDRQIESDKNSRELSPIKIKNIADYLESLYIFTIENLNRTELTDADWARTVSISDANIGPRIKNLSRAEKQSLIVSGRSSMHDFIEEHTASHFQ